MVFLILYNDMPGYCLEGDLSHILINYSLPPTTFWRRDYEWGGAVPPPPLCVTRACHGVTFTFIH
jgi:hypothetical protein